MNFLFVKYRTEKGERKKMQYERIKYNLLGGLLLINVTIV